MDVLVAWAGTTVPDPTLAALAATLDTTTLARADRLVREADRRGTIVAHALLRRRLGERLGVAPSAVTLARRCAICGSTEHGKPQVPGSAVGDRGRGEPEISLSHADGLVAVALADGGGSVGVDVEAVRPVSAWVSLRHQAFTPAEWSTAMTAQDPALALTRAWTLKEAIGKALGVGVELGFATVEVPAAAGGGAWRSARAPARAPDGRPAIVVAQLDLKPGYGAAVAVAGPVAGAESPSLQVEHAEL